MNIAKLSRTLVVPPGKKVSLAKDFDPAFAPKGITKEESEALLGQSVERLAKYQDRLYAQNTHALLVIFQAMDAAGKDGAIKHVMSGVNPQGCQVFSFKAPTSEDLDHDFLWRCCKCLPERGRIGIFNRSYYEEVLIVRVHPELLERQQIPRNLKDKKIWRRRFEDMNAFERYLTNEGVHIVKIFLNVSKTEQKKRFLERIERPEKNWKFSISDANERAFWDQYMFAYTEVLNQTSTEYAPWYVVPADYKWFARVAIATIICEKLKSLDLKYPTLDEHQLLQLKAAQQILEQETD